MLNIPIKIQSTMYYIRSDQRNYIVGYEQSSVNKKTGETQIAFIPYGFYGTLEAMFTSLLGLKIKTSTAKSLEELSTLVIKSKKELTGLYDDIVKEGDFGDDL